MADYLHACGLVVLVVRTAGGRKKHHVETKRYVISKTSNFFNNNYSTCSRDEDLFKRAFVLARLRVRTAKVRRIMHGIRIISRRTCQFEIDGCLIQQRDVCPSPVPQAILGLLHRFLVLNR